MISMGGGSNAAGVAANQQAPNGAGNGGSASAVGAPPASQSSAAAAQQPLNHVSALTPPTAIDPSVKDAANIARQAAARAAGRVATIATSAQGDTTQALVTKKTLLGTA